MTNNPNEQIKKRQRLIVCSVLGGMGIVVMAGMFLFDDGPKVTREPPKTVTLPMPGTIDDKEAWRSQESARGKATENLVQEIHDQLKAQKENSTELSKKIDALRAEKKSQSYREDKPFSSPAIILPNPPLPPDIGGLGEPVLPVPVSTNQSETPSITLNAPLTQSIEPPPRELEMITFNDVDESTNTEENELNNQKKTFLSGDKALESKQETIDFIPAGSFVRVAMLNGVDAPTGGQAQSNPLPVAFHVLDAASLANKHQLDIKDCRFVAAAWGELSSERMMGRTDSLTCIINDETVEMDVKGQVIGEDGKAGVRGRLVTKQGQLLANALFAGALSGIGKAFQQSASITTAGGGGVTQISDSQKTAQAVGGEGVGSAANMLAQYYLKAADKLFPVIETDGGRTVEILITKGAVYKGSANMKKAYPGLLKRAALERRRDEDD